MALAHFFHSNGADIISVNPDHIQAVTYKVDNEYVFATLYLSGLFSKATVFLGDADPHITHEHVYAANLLEAHLAGTLSALGD